MNTPTLHMIANACQTSVFTVDGTALVTEVDFYDHETSGVEYPKDEYPDGALILRFSNYDVEITRVVDMQPHGTITLSTRGGVTYELEYMMVNPDPFK